MSKNNQTSLNHSTTKQTTLPHNRVQSEKSQNKKERRKKQHHCPIDRAPSAFSSASFLTLACANSDLGFALQTPNKRQQNRPPISFKSQKRANILASMLISQSINLGRARAHNVVRRRNILLDPTHPASARTAKQGAQEKTTYGSAAILDWNTCRWYSMLFTSLEGWHCSTGALTSFSPRMPDIFYYASFLCMCACWSEFGIALVLACRSKIIRNSNG